MTGLNGPSEDNALAEGACRGRLFTVGGFGRVVLLVGNVHRSPVVGNWKSCVHRSVLPRLISIAVLVSLSLGLRGSAEVSAPSLNI